MIYGFVKSKLDGTE
jgi:hypothetical protein